MSEPVIEQALAVDDQGNVIGVYAVDANDPQLPGVEHAALIPMPSSPVGTGELVDVPDDPQDPEGPTHQEELLDWPAAGWTYADGVFSPPSTT